MRGRTQHAPLSCSAHPNATRSDYARMSSQAKTSMITQEDEDHVREGMEKIRWISGPECPRCGSAFASPCKEKKPMPYRCRACRLHFSVRTGTVLAESRLPLTTWVQAIQTLTESQQETTFSTFSRRLGVSRKSARSLAERILQAWKGFQRVATIHKELDCAQPAAQLEVVPPIDASPEDVLRVVLGCEMHSPVPIPTVGVAMNAVPVSSPLAWSKKLSTTDAQRETSGGLVPYLRLTKSKLPPSEDFQTFFRQKMFFDQDWKPGSFGRELNIEKCKVIFDVTFRGVALGKVACELTHGPNRWQSNNTPNTWLHWPKKLKDLLELNDLSGSQVSITRSSSGLFALALGR